MDETWPDWIFDPAKTDDALGAMTNLARYANPAQLDRLGLGHAPNRPGRHASLTTLATNLAAQLTTLGITYTVEPFNPTTPASKDAIRQRIRTVPELLHDKAGTCIDFAMVVAALCVRDQLPVSLAVAVPAGGRTCHAFVIVQDVPDGLEPPEDDDSTTHVSVRNFRDWAPLLSGHSAPRGIVSRVIDLTPRDAARGGGSATLNSPGTADYIAHNTGRLFVVDVMTAVRRCAAGFYSLPQGTRDLGITAWLPEPPPDLRDYASQRNLVPERRQLVLIGERGTGKSTTALRLAYGASAGRGWFLDGSDRATFLRSLAAAESHSYGAVLDDLEELNILTLVHRALRRLSDTSQPWVVVVDNADGPPDDVLEFFPTPSEGQLLVVTTTNEAWKDAVDAPGAWAIRELANLTADDLDDADAALPLHETERLPGLLRIARNTDPERLRMTMDEPPGPERVVRAALTRAPEAEGARLGAVDAVTAAAFMPAEQITLGWLVATFGSEPSEVQAALDAATQWGLFESSRHGGGIGDGDSAPRWMHRLVRQAVHDVMTGDHADEAARRHHAALGFAALASHRRETRPERYSGEELTQLVEFLGSVAPSERTGRYAEAVAAVLDLLEAVGRTPEAAGLAEAALPYVTESTPDPVGVRGVMLLAMARRVNFDKNPAYGDIMRATAWCDEIVRSCEGSESLAHALLAGRTRAMQGNMMKKSTTAAGRPDDLRPRDVLQKSIDVLTESYNFRRNALTDETGRLLPDPQRHVDRGWYNLGGPYIKLADETRHDDPDAVPALLSSSLAAYAGSLSLRPQDDLYRAASLWGVALALYMSAVWAPGLLDLSQVEPVEELNIVTRDKGPEACLAVAERCSGRALAIWSEIHGRTSSQAATARALQLKICLAWHILTASGDSARNTLLADAVAPFRKDLDLD